MYVDISGRLLATSTSRLSERASPLTNGHSEYCFRPVNLIGFNVPEDFGCLLEGLP